MIYFPTLKWSSLILWLEKKQKKFGYASTIKIRRDDYHGIDVSSKMLSVSLQIVGEFFYIHCKCIQHLQQKNNKAALLLHCFDKMHDDNYCPPDYVNQYQGGTIINGVWWKKVGTPHSRHGRMMPNNASRSELILFVLPQQNYYSCKK